MYECKLINNEYSICPQCSIFSSLSNPSCETRLLTEVTVTLPNEFEKHILCLVSSCFYRLKVLYRIRPYIKTEVRIKLCESLVLSKLNYADTVYGPCLYAKTQRLLQRVQ